MPGLIIAPDLPKVLVQRQGIFTVQAGDAAVECNCPQLRGSCGGIEISKIPLKFRSFELLCLDMGKRFISRQYVRGYEWDGRHLLLHGPWPSKVANLSDTSSPSWAAAMKRDKVDNVEHPERVLDFVAEPSEFYLDYILVGDFLFQDRMTDLEVPDGDGRTA